MKDKIQQLELATSSKIFKVGTSVRTDASPAQVLDTWRSIVGQPTDVRLGQPQQMIDADGNTMTTYTTYAISTSFDAEVNEYQFTIGIIVKLSALNSNITVFAGMLNLAYCLNLSIWGADNIVHMQQLNLPNLRLIIDALQRAQKGIIEETRNRFMQLSEVEYSQEEFQSRFLRMISTFRNDEPGIIPLALKALYDDERYSSMSNTDRKIYECLTDTVKHFTPGKLISLTQKIQGLFFPEDIPE